ncbi:ABC transporter permease [Pseudonocardia nigra]|uniref:ABC transporter permease n=1 Tax=Pseudonocardia nigra TaxID=1921578 RepID=UPI001C5D9938|nr:ABC transporter permease [Pseudonocardia nigra]
MTRRLTGSRPLMIGGVLVLLVILTALLAPLLAPQDPYVQDLADRLLGPGENGHLLGTDQFGRDLLSRLIYGARVSLQAGVVAVAIGAGVGLVLGLFAGYLGGWVDMVIGRLFDIILSFPTILLALAIVAVLGPSMVNMIIAIGVTTVPNYGRVLRGAVIAVKSREFMQASEAFGATNAYVITRHAMPNVLPSLIVTTSLGIAAAILVEATLSFLGLGVPPPTATWGSVINDGKQYLDIAPGISTWAGLAIVVAVLGFSLLGDGLRDVLDPRLHK